MMQANEWMLLSAFKFFFFSLFFFVENIEIYYSKDWETITL